ncbi:MAG TPA: hypothetical protein VI643_06405 [Planctomycetota bacterium]|nr:hypothetical protein [Planctomycetota bacterium]
MGGKASQWTFEHEARKAARNAKTGTARRFPLISIPDDQYAADRAIVNKNSAGRPLTADN